MTSLSQVLSIPALSRLFLVIDNADLTKEIKGVTVLDYEFDKDQNAEEIILDGDFIISSFIVAKDNEDLLFSIVLSLIQSNTSAIAIKNIYYQEVPKKIKDLASKHRYPIFIFDSKTYYEDIIYAIMAEINLNSLNISYEKIIDKIFRNHYTNNEIQMTLGLDENDYYVFMLNFCDSISYDLFCTNKLHFKYFFYYNSIILICSKEHNIQYYLDFFNDNIEKKYYIGLGKLKDDFTTAFMNSLNSLKAAMYKDVVFIENYLNSYLSSIIENYQSKSYIRFMENYLKKIKDNYHLLDILNIYISNEGDMIASAKECHMHVNTFRYQIEKARRLIDPLASMYSFSINLTYALTTYNLNNMVFSI